MRVVKGAVVSILLVRFPFAFFYLPDAVVAAIVDDANKAKRFSFRPLALPDRSISGNKPSNPVRFNEEFICGASKDPLLPTVIENSSFNFLGPVKIVRLSHMIVLC